MIVSLYNKEINLDTFNHRLVKEDLFIWRRVQIPDPESSLNSFTAATKNARKNFS